MASSAVDRPGWRQRAGRGRVLFEAIDSFACPEEFPGQRRRFRHTRLTALVTRLRSAPAGGGAP